MSPLLVSARLDSPLVEAERHPLMLDSMLAWARALDRDLPPLRGDVDPEIPLPLDRWEDAGVWGWKCSRGVFEPVGWVTVNVRRNPDMQAMSRFTGDRRFHLALGPHKARDTAYEAAWIREITWSLVATDVDELARLLDRITGIGKLAAHGYGHVSEWVTSSGSAEGWRNRPMPSTHPGKRHRPPYWHPHRES